MNNPKYVFHKNRIIELPNITSCKHYIDFDSAKNTLIKKLEMKISDKLEEINSLNKDIEALKVSKPITRMFLIEWSNKHIKEINEFINKEHHEFIYKEKNQINGGHADDFYFTKEECVNALYNYIKKTYHKFTQIAKDRSDDFLKRENLHL